jgi:hypothetical protein
MSIIRNKCLYLDIIPAIGNVKRPILGIFNSDIAFPEIPNICHFHPILSHPINRVKRVFDGVNPIPCLFRFQPPSMHQRSREVIL